MKGRTRKRTDARGPGDQKSSRLAYEPHVVSQFLMIQHRLHTRAPCDVNYETGWRAGTRCSPLPSMLRLPCLLSPRVLPYFGALLRTRVLTTSVHLAPRPRRSTGSRSLRARPWRSVASSTRAPTASTRRFARRGLASWRHARRAPRRARRSKPNSPLSIKTRTTFRGGRPAAARATRGRRSSGVPRVPAVREV